MKVVSSILASSVVYVAGCGATFEAVDTTGKLGQKIDGAGVFDAAYELCILQRAMTPDWSADAGKPGEPCAEAEATAERWTKVANGLSAYSAKLSELAQGEDVAPTDQLDAVLGAAASLELSPLDSDQDAALAAFASQVIKVLSLSYRKGVLDEVVRDTNPSIQTVKKTISGEVDLRLEAIRGLDATLAQLSAAPATARPAPELPAPPEASASPPGWSKQLVDALERRQRDQAGMNQVLNQNASVALRFVRHQLALRAVAYRDLAIRVAAFAAAHDELAKNVGKLDAKDLAPRVLDVAKSAVKLAGSMKTKTAATGS